MDVGKWWLWRSENEWKVYPPMRDVDEEPVSPGGQWPRDFDSWSAAMAFILATDTRKAA